MNQLPIFASPLSNYEAIWKCIAMIIIPYINTVSPGDILAIQGLGYKIMKPSVAAEVFINRHFPNLELKTFLAGIDALLAPHSPVGINRELELREGIPPQLSFALFSDDYEDPTTGLGLCRRFTYEGADLVVWHEYFRLPLVSRRHGISKKVFKLQLQQYINLGVSKIRVHAALNDGGYVWARAFFTADNKGEMDVILGKARIALAQNEFIAVKKIYDNYYAKSHDGKAFPINKWAELPFMESVLKGSHWHGAVDLKNPEQFNNFTRYVIR